MNTKTLEICPFCGTRVYVAKLPHSMPVSFPRGKYIIMRDRPAEPVAAYDSLYDAVNAWDRRNENGSD